MYHRLNMAVVAKANLGLCRVAKCLSRCGECSSDILVCVDPCPHANARLIINILNECIQGSALTLGKVTLSSMRCCSGGCVEDRGTYTVLSVYVPTIFLNVLPDVFIRDVETVWRLLSSSDIVDRIVRKIIDERARFGVSRTLIGLVRLINSNQDSLETLLRTLGLPELALLSRDELRSIVERVISHVYP